MAPKLILHHFPLDPFSRQARLALGEKRLAFVERVERYWERPETLEALNPSGMTPVLIDGRGDERLVVCEIRAVLEHLEERAPEPPLLPIDAAGRAEARRLLEWFDRKFHNEVNSFLLHEKMEKRLFGLGAPDLANLRSGRDALRAHMKTLEALLATRDWLAGDALSLGDIAAAAHLSVIDYLGEAPGRDFPLTNTWYARRKSRPPFLPLLADRLPGLPPATHYDDLDF
ncbi:FtsZ-binding protein FzlA [soil metagenome]